MNQLLELFSSIFTNHGFIKKKKTEFIKKYVDYHYFFEFDVVDANRFKFYYGVSFPKFDRIFDKVFFPTISFRSQSIRIPSEVRFRFKTATSPQGAFSVYYSVSPTSDLLVYKADEVQKAYNDLQYLFEIYCLPFYSRFNSLTDFLKVLRSIDIFSEDEEYPIGAGTVVWKDLLLSSLIGPAKYQERKIYYESLVGSQPPLDLNDSKTLRYDRFWKSTTEQLPALEAFDLSPYGDIF